MNSSSTPGTTRAWRWRRTPSFIPTTGQIVCRSSIADPSNGCVPINRIGIGGVTQAALDYIIPSNPYREQELTQDVAAFNFATNDVFSTWAGPVSLAFGGEWREEKIDGFVEQQYQTGWLYGNYLVTKGDYHVTEGYIETVVPLWEGLDFNGALRFTDYSISGNVETWKAGLTYQPIADLKFRVTGSKDIRAPNLNELFAAGTARTNTVNVPPSNQALQFVQKQTGSLALVPEEAESLGIGMVVTPSFVPGLAFSVDYFDIEIEDAIGTVTAQNTVDLCFEQNVQSFCDNISYITVGDVQQISEILLVPFNFASQRTKGLDIEASYRRPLGHGDLSLRALATHYIDNITDNGIDFPVGLCRCESGSQCDAELELSSQCHLRAGRDVVDADRARCEQRRATTTRSSSAPAAARPRRSSIARSTRTISTVRSIWTRRPRTRSRWGRRRPRRSSRFATCSTAIPS